MLYILSACHAGLLADNLMPVGSGEIILCIFLVFNIIFVLSLRDLLPALALVALRSHTRSSWLPCRFLLCLLTQHS